MKKSPSGSLFPYPYKGGELHCFKLGSFYDDEKALIERIKIEESFYLSENCCLNIWMDMYKSRLTKKATKTLVECVAKIAPKNKKIAFVGNSLFNQMKIRYFLKKKNISTYKFFTDPELAKTWIINDKP